jgi:hypothetical protein
LDNEEGRMMRRKTAEKPHPYFPEIRVDNVIPTELVDGSHFQIVVLREDQLALIAEAVVERLKLEYGA